MATPNLAAPDGWILAPGPFPNAITEAEEPVKTTS
jgi:hypothetical protein